MEKQIITDLFLTKEAFEQYTLRLRQQRAMEYGMTLEQYDQAVLNGNVVQSISGSLNS